MYLYFDANGILREIINDQSIRQGDYRSDVLYAYFEDAPENALMGVNIQYPDGTYSGEQTTSETVTEAIPYDPNADHKWFKDYIPYKFYIYEFGSLAQAGVWRCTARLISGTTIKAQGTFVFSVAEGAIEEDVNLTQAQYDALLQLLADVAYTNRSNLFSQANTFDGITTLNGLPMVTGQRIAGNLTDRGVWWTIDDSTEGTSISVGDFAKTSAITLRVKDGMPTIEWEQDGQSGSLTLKDGEIATQEDLEEKQDTLIAGDGIVIQNNVITAAASKVIDSLEEGSPFPVSSDALYGVITRLQNTVNGKSRAFALSYNDTSVDTGNYQRYHYIDADRSVKAFATVQELNDYISGYTNMNAIFNSQADTISITASNTYIIVRQTNTYFATYLILRKPLGTGVFENITIALGDVFLVYETDVPDRWLSSGPYSASGAVWSKMETAKVDINNMATTDTEQMISGQKTFTQPIKIPAANDGGRYEIGSRNGYYLTFDHYTSSNSRDGTPLNLIYGTRIDTYHIRPSTDNIYDIGWNGIRYRNIYLSGDLSDGTNNVTVAHLAQNTPTQWYGTQAQYDALGTYDSNTIYNILES